MDMIPRVFLTCTFYYETWDILYMHTTIAVQKCGDVSSFLNPAAAVPAAGRQALGQDGVNNTDDIGAY